MIDMCLTRKKPAEQEIPLSLEQNELMKEAQARLHCIAQGDTCSTDHIPSTS